MTRKLAIALLVAGCGRVGFDARVDALADALVPPVFGPAVEITALSSPTQDDDASISFDELEIFFDSDRAGGGGDDLYTSRRATTSAPWPAPTRVVELSSANSDVAPALTTDALTIYFSRNGVGGGYDIWMSTRLDRDSPWAPPQRVPELSAMNEDTNAQPTNDLEIWLASRRGGETVRQLYRATRAAVTDPWSPPVRVESLFDDAYYTADPWPVPDGSALYFVSDRPDAVERDIWWVTRPTPETFGTPVLLTSLNTESVDGDPTLVPDQSVIYFSSRRPGRPGGDFNIYRAARP